MRSWRSGLVVDGEFLTPHELNAEIGEAVAAVHNLSAENFDPNRIPPARFRNDAWGRIRIVTVTTTRTAAHGAGSNHLVTYPIPDDAGDPWQEEVEAKDGVLQISLSTTMAGTSGTQNIYLWTGIKVDGTLVAQAPIASTIVQEDTQFTMADVPVGPGARLIEPVYGFYHEALVTGISIDWNERVLAIRELAR